MVKPDFWVPDSPPRGKHHYFSQRKRLELERVYDIKLPASYISLLQNRTGFINEYCYFPCFDEDGFLTEYVHVDFASLDEVIRDTRCCLEIWHMPPGIIAINVFQGHDCIALNYRNCEPGQEPEVSYLAQGYVNEIFGCPDEEVETDGYYYGITRLSRSFEELLDKLLNGEQFEALAKASPHSVSA